MLMFISSYSITDVFVFWSPTISGTITVSFITIIKFYFGISCKWQIKCNFITTINPDFNLIFILSKLPLSIPIDLLHSNCGVCRGDGLLSTRTGVVSPASLLLGVLPFFSPIGNTQLAAICIPSSMFALKLSTLSFSSSCTSCSTQSNKIILFTSTTYCCRICSYMSVSTLNCVMLSLLLILVRCILLHWCIGDYRVVIRTDVWPRLFYFCLIPFLNRVSTIILLIRFLVWSSGLINVYLIRFGCDNHVFVIVIFVDWQKSANFSPRSIFSPRPNGLTTFPHDSCPAFAIKSPIIANTSFELTWFK